MLETIAPEVNCHTTESAKPPKPVQEKDPVLWSIIILYICHDPTTHDSLGQRTRPTTAFKDLTVRIPHPNPCSCYWHNQADQGHVYAFPAREAYLFSFSFSFFSHPILGLKEAITATFSCRHRLTWGNMNTPNTTAIAAMAAALTPEQIAQAQQNIDNFGRITTHDFKVGNPR